MRIGKGRRMSTTEKRLRDLLDITKLLSTERDVDALLELILTKSRELTDSDAGSLYVIEGEDTTSASRKLRFKMAQNASVDMDFEEFVFDVSNSSLAGWVVLNQEPLAIEDAYHMDPTLGIKHSREVDEKLGYRTQSILTAPMITNRGQVIGVIQLINKKTDTSQKLSGAEDNDGLVVPFDVKDRELLASFTSQAAIAVENAQLQAEIQAMFEGFVDASVHAIEQRDPTTSGHSRRVSLLTINLAKVVDRVDSGRYGYIKFSRDDLEELKVAGLLHDFGKVGVRETVLVKANKLPPLHLDLVLTRLDHVARLEETRFLRRQIDLIKSGAPEAEIKALEEEWTVLERKIRKYKEIITRADKPTILPEGDFEVIGDIAATTYQSEDGSVHPYLSAEEIEFLKIRKGTLTSDEMEEIRSHARHTYEFLERVPWGRKFRQLSRIAAAHHEKIDGSGYPDGLKEAEIPVQSKMMAVADIFDALTASDRPYKKAVPVDKALKILGFEVKDNHLDKDLVEMFEGAKVYLEVIDPDQS
jgi:HD-GYP domain-containing protein (c-di-GMP phosphodiesterase class II)